METKRAKHPRVDPLLRWIRETPTEEAETACSTYGTSLGYLKQIAYGNKLAGLIGSKIELITNKKCRRQDLRPNDWASIWPELAAAISEPENEKTRGVAG